MLPIASPTTHHHRLITIYLHGVVSLSNAAGQATHQLSAHHSHSHISQRSVEETRIQGDTEDSKEHENKKYIFFNKVNSPDDISGYRFTNLNPRNNFRPSSKHDNINVVFLCIQWCDHAQCPGVQVAE
jgi:hypothetical protein